MSEEDVTNKIAALAERKIIYNKEEGENVQFMEKKLQTLTSASSVHSICGISKGYGASVIYQLCIKKEKVNSKQKYRYGEPYMTSIF